jgi:DNA-binding ferritin-like protein
VSSFLRVLLQIESDTRLLHWYTTSHANHKATNALYSKLTEKIDEFVERALGRNRAVNVGKSFDVRVRVPTKSQLVSELKKAASFLEKDLPRSMNKRASDLLTTRDDLLGEIRKTLYLLSQK